MDKDKLFKLTYDWLSDPLKNVDCPPFDHCTAAQKIDVTIALMEDYQKTERYYTAMKTLYPYLDTLLKKEPKFKRNLPDWF